jgi:hypothetical protein
MNLPTFADIWGYLSPLASAILGFMGNYLLERRRERRKKSGSLQIVECVEMVNTKVFDKQLLGPAASDIQIKIPEGGPKSKLIDVREIHFAQYRLGNLSDSPASRLLVTSKNAPGAIWFDITEGAGHSSPDWEKQKGVILQEEKVSEKRGWEGLSSTLPKPIFFHEA